MAIHVGRTAAHVVVEVHVDVPAHVGEEAEGQRGELQGRVADLDPGDVARAQMKHIQDRLGLEERIGHGELKALTLGKLNCSTQKKESDEIPIREKRTKKETRKGNEWEKNALRKSDTYQRRSRG